MADPYAARAAGPAADRPAAGEPLRELSELAADLGGVAVADLSGLTEFGGDPELRFVAVARSDEGLLPPLARLGAEQALALVLEPGDSPIAAEQALAALRRTTRPLFLLKLGAVGGPEGRHGRLAVEPGDLRGVLAAALEPGPVWERDPDFGWELLADGPGVQAPLADALLPRLHYARADRVYEHAELVAESKRGRWERLRGIDDLNPEILAAAGWPPEPTASSWKD